MYTTTCVHLLPYYTHRTHTAPSYNLGIRIPPSKRIDSAFMMGDSTKNFTNSANSDGTPNRSVGNTCAFFKLSPTRAPAGVLKPAVKGVAMIPGMMVLILTPLDPMSLSNKKRKQQQKQVSPGVTTTTPTGMSQAYLAMGNAIPTTPALLAL